MPFQCRLKNRGYKALSKYAGKMGEDGGWLKGGLKGGSKGGLTEVLEGLELDDGFVEGLKGVVGADRVSCACDGVCDGVCDDTPLPCSISRYSDTESRFDGSFRVISITSSLTNGFLMRSNRDVAPRVGLLASLPLLLLLLLLPLLLLLLLLPILPLLRGDSLEDSSSKDL